MASIPIGGKQVHDANVVATMQTHGLRSLLTHNTGDFARFGALIQVEPINGKRSEMAEEDILGQCGRPRNPEELALLRSPRLLRDSAISP